MGALYWMNKVSWSGVLIIWGASKIREKKGDHLADAIVLISTTVAVTAIWIPEIKATMVGAALASAAGPVVVVAVSTYAIGGVIAFVAADPEDPGWYGAEALKEYYHDPVGTTADIAEEYIVDPVAHWTQEQIIDPVASWTIRRVNELNKAKAQVEKVVDVWTEEIFKNRWMTGPYLPF